MLNNKYKLELAFSLVKMQFHSNLRTKTIRNGRRESNFENFKTFLNYNRVVHAMILIDSGYLHKHTISSLSVESTLTRQTFFRVFKYHTKQTPLAYSLKKRQSICFTLKN